MPFNLPEPTRLPLRPGQPTMSSIPMRPSMPIPMDEHLHRSMPTPPSPYDMDQRDSRVMSPPFETRLGLEGPEYFSAMGAAGPFGPRYHQGVPFPPGLEPEAMMGGHPQYIDELVRRTNLMVQFVNSQVRPAARYCQLQPKMAPDAKFPPEFRVPKTLEEVRAMDPSSIDRVLRAYGLPTDLRSLRLTSQDAISPRAAQQAKLCTLFDFLGATQLAERQRMKRTVCLPY